MKLSLIALFSCLFVLSLSSSAFATKVVPGNPELTSSPSIVDEANQTPIPDGQDWLSPWAEAQIGNFLAHEEGCIQSRVLAYGWYDIATEGSRVRNFREFLMVVDRAGTIEFVIERKPEESYNYLSDLSAEVNQSDWIFLGIGASDTMPTFRMITTINWWEYLGMMESWEMIPDDVDDMMSNIVGFIPTMSRVWVSDYFAQPMGFTPIPVEAGSVCVFHYSSEYDTGHDEVDKVE